MTGGVFHDIRGMGLGAIVKCGGSKVERRFLSACSSTTGPGGRWGAKCHGLQWAGDNVQFCLYVHVFQRRELFYIS